MLPTQAIYDQAINALSEGTIIKIQDFSENFTWLLPNEIVAIHWTQEQATVHPVVVLRKVEDQVREDHFVFVSDDLKHDILFVEICNSMIHKHYADRNIPVTRDIEFNDGCSSQFKCINVFTQFSYRPVPTTRVYFETSHSKSKSDGLGGVVKCAATREVNGRYTFLHQPFLLVNN